MKFKVDARWEGEEELNEDCEGVFVGGAIMEGRGGRAMSSTAPAAAPAVLFEIGGRGEGGGGGMGRGGGGGGGEGRRGGAIAGEAGLNVVLGVARHRTKTRYNSLQPDEKAATRCYICSI